MLKLFTDPRCLGQRAPAGYPEKPERLQGILDRWQGSLDAGESSGGAEPSWETAVRAVHDGEYVDRFRRAVERGDGLLDSADNPLCAESWNAAGAAVSTALRGVDWMMGGEGRHAFAAVRPPGHHAERAAAMGFCFFNNVAVAAQHLLDQHGLSRVAILDFDVHHGNGTQHLFESRADVLFLSLHQHPFYPGTGAAEERGVGAGEGATLNVPLPAGSGDERYAEAFQGEILPAVRQFRPEAFLISAGFDAWRGDPLGGMRVSEEGFRHWGSLLAGLAEEICGGRLFSILEGGYDLQALPELVQAYLGGTSGQSAD